MVVFVEHEIQLTSVKLPLASFQGSVRCKDGEVKYEVVAEAYRDLEQASGRLMLIDRLASLLALTPQELLPTVCYMCQGLVAPEFAAVDLGMAEKLALRAVATATGVEPGDVVAAVREAGDLGQAAEQLLAATAGDREPSLDVAAVVATLHQIARAEGSGSQGRKLDLLAGLLALATPLEARYLLRLVTGNLRLGIGTPTISMRWRRCTPAAGRTGQYWSGRTTSAPISASSGPRWPPVGWPVQGLQVRPGNPVRVMLAQRLSDASEIVARLGGRCMAEYKYDGMRVQAHRTADGHIELFTRRQERVSNQFPDVVELLQAGLGPREAILEGEIVAMTLRPASCAPSRKSCSAAASTESPKPRVMCRSGCSASSCCTPMARTSPNGPIWTVGPDSPRQSPCRTGCG